MLITQMLALNTFNNTHSAHIGKHMHRKKCNVSLNHSNLQWLTTFPVYIFDEIVPKNHSEYHSDVAASCSIKVKITVFANYHSVRLPSVRNVYLLTVLQNETNNNTKNPNQFNKKTHKKKDQIFQSQNKLKWWSIGSIQSKIRLKTTYWLTFDLW